MPKGYWIARVDVRDAEGYKDYVAAAKLAFDRFDAKFLARGGAHEKAEGPAAPATSSSSFRRSPRRMTATTRRSISARSPSARRSPTARSCWSRES